MHFGIAIQKWTGAYNFCQCSVDILNAGDFRNFVIFQVEGNSIQAMWGAI